MQKTSNLKPSQAAAVLAISASTLRRWSADYARHLSPEARGEDGRHRTYTPGDLATLKHAGDLLKTHAPGTVDQLLGIADETQQAAALATLPTIAQLIGQLNDRVAALEADRAALAGQVDDLKAADQVTRSEVARLVERHHKQRTTQQAELDELRAAVAALQARRPWWQRLRG
jgi:DNA-binding transcriptional MerR regulator